LKKASIKDKEIVVDILVSAFAPLKEDNSVNLIVKQDEHRISRMRILMEYLFEKAITFGEIYITENNKACILLKFSHKDRITPKTILLDIKLVFKCIGIERVFKILKRQQIAKKNYPKIKHIRPVIMGAKTETNGRGNAARLMLEVINHYNDNKLPVIIDVASEKNIKMYQKLGFKIFKKDNTLGFPIYFLKLN